MFESVNDADTKYYLRHGGQRRKRQSNLLTYSDAGTFRDSSGIVQSPGTPYGANQVTIDQTNGSRWRLRRFRDRPGGRLFDVGGPFASETWTISAPTRVDADWTRRAVHGWAHPTSNYSGWAKSVHDGTMVTDRTNSLIGDVALMGHGATAIARTLPTAPEMSISTSLAELTQGLPSIIGRQLKKDPSAHAVGGEYLNFQFGLVPLFNDARDILTLTSEYQKILEQFQRDNGRLVRRGITLVDTSSTTVTTTSNQYGYIGGGKNPLIAIGYANTATTEVKDSTKVWFSGAYKLAYPIELDNRLKEITEFNRVYGVLPNAELAWNLLPFSWLADWFTNVGDVVKNASTLGRNLQLAYGYVMCQESRFQRTYGDYDSSYRYDRGRHTVRIDSSFSYSRKRRLKATPFGFSVGFADLSGSQKAILTALGLSRLRL